MNKVKKNDVVILDIIDMNQDGEGIGKAEGYTLFVKDTVIGDKVEIKVIKTGKSFGYGRMLRIIEPSVDRIEARCKVARQCGGCQLQAYAYKKQLEFKQNKIKNNLQRIGKITDFVMEPIIGMEEPWRYRNKAQFPVGRNRNGEIIMGFYAGRTHSLIENEDCYLGAEINARILACIREYMEENGVLPYDEATHLGLIRHILIRKGHYTGELMVCLVINGDKLPNIKSLIKKLSVFETEGLKSVILNQNKEKTNVILGRKLKVLWGKGFIEDTIEGIVFQISPLSFYQVNVVQTERLYHKALEFADLTGEEMVWDLYCGIGTISLFLAKKAKKVYGVEIVPNAIENARENAKRNGIENVEFFLGKAEEVLPEWCKRHEEKIDVIVVDPPRKGCEEGLLRTMAQRKPERIVYVSCDSATLARDLKVLEESGYKVKKVQGVDMFPQGVHCEVCVELYRK